MASCGMCVFPEKSHVDSTIHNMLKTIYLSCAKGIPMDFLTKPAVISSESPEGEDHVETAGSSLRKVGQDSASIQAALHTNR